MKSSPKILEKLSEWPSSWAIDDNDVAKGQEITLVLRAFIESLIKLELASTTIRRHVNNLWLLGGELIREINIYPDQRKKTALQLIKNALDDEGGPYCRHLNSESEMKAFDATCKKLNQFIKGDVVHLIQRNIVSRHRDALLKFN